MNTSIAPFEILLVEDNPGDVRLVVEAIREGPVRGHVNVTRDGVEALAYLRREGRYASAPRPDLILLDLNLPRLNGSEVLAAIKADDALRAIPVVVLTTSQTEQDVLHCYQLNANCYVAKPVNLDQFLRVIRAIEEFWLTVVALPAA